MNNYFSRVAFIILGLSILACEANNNTDESQNTPPPAVDQFTIKAGDFLETSDSVTTTDGSVKVNGKGWLSYEIKVPTAGRYQVDITGQASADGTKLWIEDYIDNKDGRTYDITGKYKLNTSAAPTVTSKYGSPLNQGVHRIKLHYEGSLALNEVNFKLMKKHQTTPVALMQSMQGDEWEVVWSDEFEGSSVDTSKWLFDVGDWGWGNNELQYYTDNDPKNARVENGKLIIEATKNADGVSWNSARLTTRGKTSFKYGKIEFSAMVPEGRGTWAAGWTLGDDYVDELSWPYCGEIDILETVGYEMNNGNGIAHSTVHTPAYYFKINNQISSVTDVPNVTTEFHTYAVEWTPEEIRGYVDGRHYYTYDKNANELEWPFDKPQNIILNLAIGGGWGGARGVDESMSSQKFILDYVRVYQLK